MTRKIILLMTAVLSAVMALSTSSSAQEKKKYDENLAVLKTTKRVFAVVINYDLPLKEMIALGKYDDVVLDEDDVSSISNILDELGTGHGQENKVNVELVTFPRGLKYQEILRALDARGLRAATIPELLALGAQYPYLQDEDQPIVSLSPLLRFSCGLENMIGLSTYAHHRLLGPVVLHNGRWLDVWRLAVAPNSSRF